MSSTLSYGYTKPATGDRGTTLFTFLETDIQQINDHAHNGVDSAFIPPSSIQHFTCTIAAAAWSGSNGTYTARATVPVGLSGAATYNDNYFYSIITKISTAGSTKGDVIYPTIEWFSTSQFDVTVNDNTLDLIFILV